MSTVLYSGCHLDGKDASGSDRLLRTIRWLDYYQSLQKDLQFNGVLLLDNGSSKENLKILKQRNYFRSRMPIKIEELTYLSPLPNLEYGYPYCWRTLWHIRELIERGFTKIIAIDTDAFILSPRLAQHIRNLNNGWEAFYIPRYDFPSSECFILCQDAFDHFLNFTSVAYEVYLGTCMETSLPFTWVATEFKVDRFGEDRIAQTPEMDAYFQAQLDIPLTFNKRVKTP